MNINAIIYNKIIQTGICFLLCAGIGCSLLLPAANMVHIHPENPISQMEGDVFQELSVLEVGENISHIQNIVMPSGDNTSANGSGKANSQDDTQGEEAKDNQEQEESEPEEGEQPGNGEVTEPGEEDPTNQPIFDTGNLDSETVIDGQTPYLDVFEEYYDEIVEYLENNEVPDDLREVIEKYLEMIKNKV